MFSIKNEKGNIKKILFIIMLLYFLISLFGVLNYGDANYLGTPSKANNDDVRYIRSAEVFLNTGMLTYHETTAPTAYIMPGITFFIAIFMKIFGYTLGITAFRIFQVLVQTASIYIMFLLCRKILNSRISLIACAINLLSISEYYTPTLLLTETLFKFFTLVLIYFSIYAVEKKEIKYYIAGGIFWWAACMVRPTIAAYPVIILIMWLIKKYKFTEMLKFTSITLLVFCTLMSPWWIRNYVVFNKFIPFTASAGNPFLKGTYINYKYSVDNLLDQTGRTGMEKNQNEMNAGIYRFKTNAAAHPIKYIIWYTLGKTYYFWSTPFYWKEMFNISSACATYFHIAVLFLALFGTILAFMKKNEKLLPVFLVIVYFNLIYLPFYTFNRYAYPIMPCVYILAGYFIYNVLNRLHKEADIKKIYEENIE